MSRPEFESVVAGAPRESLKRNLINLTTGTIARDAIVNFDVYSPTGTISRVNTMAFNVGVSPVGGFTFNIFYTNGNRAFITMSVASAGIIFNNNWWQSPVPATLNPNNLDTLIGTMRNIFFDSTVGLRFQILNQGTGNGSFNGSNVELYTIEQQISS